MTAAQIIADNLAPLGIEVNILREKWPADFEAFVALFDQTSFAKFRLEGRDACAVLDRISANRIDVAFLLRLFRWFETEGYGETIASPSVRMLSFSCSPRCHESGASGRRSDRAREVAVRALARAAHRAYARSGISCRSLSFAGHTSFGTPGTRRTRAPFRSNSA